MPSDETGGESLNRGDLVGRYRTLEPAGAGSGGDVYRAEDTTLHREVALKLLARSLSEDMEFHRRFQSEAQAAALLSHPNIGTVRFDIPAVKGAIMTVDQKIGRPA